MTVVYVAVILAAIGWVALETYRGMLRRLGAATERVVDLEARLARQQETVTGLEQRVTELEQKVWSSSAARDGG